jgi:hypothetical protein
MPLGEINEADSNRGYIYAPGNVCRGMITIVDANRHIFGELSGGGEGGGGRGDILINDNLGAERGGLLWGWMDALLSLISSSAVDLLFISSPDHFPPTRRLAASISLVSPFR